MLLLSEIEIGMPVNHTNGRQGIVLNKVYDVYDRRWYIHIMDTSGVTCRFFPERLSRHQSL